MPPNAITAAIVRDDGGEAPAFCLMAAYRSEKDAMDAFALIAAAPAQPVEMTDDEKHLRRMLCVAHAGALAYMDDGEASDSRMHPTIDFLRDSPKDIQRKIWERNRAALAAAPAQAAPARDLAAVIKGAADKLDAAVRCHPNAVDTLIHEALEILDGDREPDAIRASHGQAPAGATLPDGWVPLTITHEGQHPEEVAYGPQVMMDRLGKWLGKYFAQAAQAADSVTAVEREQERIAFKDAHRHLELYEVPDAWGRPMFKHSHVEASWLGWIARASRGQAPAGAGPSPAPAGVQWQCGPQTTAFGGCPACGSKQCVAGECSRPMPDMMGIINGLADRAAQADSVQEDAARWNAWSQAMVEGANCDTEPEFLRVLSDAIGDAEPPITLQQLNAWTDAARAAQKEGE